MPYAKAIAAFIVPLVVSMLVPFGITADSTVVEVVNLLVLAIVTAVSVYMVPNVK